MFESEKLLDETVRCDINEMINKLYIECKDEYGKFNEDLFLKFGSELKEKASQHIQSMLDAYKRL